MKITIKTVNKEDKNTVEKILKDRWGSTKIVYQGKVFFANQLPGFLAVADNHAVGLITYKIKGKFCQIITLDALLKRKGIGTALINRLKKEGEKEGWKKIKVVTTNDNLDGLRFYQRRGFVLKKIYSQAVNQSRKIKQEIPLIGD